LHSQQIMGWFRLSYLDAVLSGFIRSSDGLGARLLRAKRQAIAGV